MTLPQLARFGIDSDLELKVMRASWSCLPRALQLPLAPHPRPRPRSPTPPNILALDRPDPHRFASPQIQKRGAPPEGGGQVFFRCPTVRTLKPVVAIDEGQIKRIRGIAYATRVSPQTANRIVESARALLNTFIPDVFIYTDHYKGAESGKYVVGVGVRRCSGCSPAPPGAPRASRSPGFGISLVAESTTGVLLHTELYAKAGDTPEDLGRQAAKQLFLEISRVRLLPNGLCTFSKPRANTGALLCVRSFGQGGCTDALHQGFNLLLMALGPEDVSKLRIGKLTKPTYVGIRSRACGFNPGHGRWACAASTSHRFLVCGKHRIQLLRDLQTFFGVTFKITPDPANTTVLLTCLGVGFLNMNKRVT